MEIAAVRATRLSAPVPAERQHTSDFGRMRTFDTVLVRVETRCGLVGHGEAKAMVGSQADDRALAVLVEEEIGPTLAGEDPRDIARIWELVYNGPRAHLALASGHAFPVLGRRGLTISALSGIDIALWDILGKHLGVPVWQLLGGRCHARLPAYASGGWAPVDGIGDELAGYVERGFGAVKMRVGAQDGDVAVSAARVAAARERLGPDVDLYCDAHGTCTVADAKRFCRLVADHRVGWFEEPVCGDDLPGLAEVRASTDVPIATGESEQTRFAFRDIAAARAADVFQPDLAICGGITEGMRIAALAAAHQIRLAPHMWGSVIMFAAGLHVCAMSPAAFVVEYSLGQNPLMHDLAPGSFEVTDGHVAMPTRPGLGVDVDEAFVAANTAA